MRGQSVAKLVLSSPGFVSLFQCCCGEHEGLAHWLSEVIAAFSPGVSMWPMNGGRF